MQFQLPQFIETEDKIVGPFSIKQFAYLCGIGGLIAMLYFILTPTVWFIIALPLAASAVALAFVKVNGQPLARILAAAFRFYWNPQTYVWQSRHPNIPKAEAPKAGGGFSLERIISGLALKTAWREVQTGNTTSPAEASKRNFTQLRERYEVFRKTTGDRAAARRVDYR